MVPLSFKFNTISSIPVQKRHELKRRRNQGSKTKRVLRRCIRDIKKSNEHRDIAETRIKLLAETIIEEAKVRSEKELERQWKS